MTKDIDKSARVRTTQDNPAGRVEFDSRGNSVWRWKRQDGEKDSTSVLLKRLENTELSLEPTRSLRIAKGKAGPGRDRAAEGRGPALEDERTGGGFDPYNNVR